jgi:putative membrane protein
MTQLCLSNRDQMMKAIWLITFTLVLVWSVIMPKDYYIWALEVAPAIIGFIILVATYKSFRLTGLLYLLILMHCIILMVGGHYTYAEVPLFEHLKPVFGFERNNYDKLGHFMQGFAPAIIAREILIRKEVVHSAKWRNFFIICFCLALSAFYELIEWFVAIATGEAADAFLATQGYVWDTQTDMAFALFGAVLSLVLLSRMHDTQLRKIASQGSRPASSAAV